MDRSEWTSAVPARTVLSNPWRLQGVVEEIGRIGCDLRLIGGHFCLAANPLYKFVSLCCSASQL